MPGSVGAVGDLPLCVLYGASELVPVGVPAQAARAGAPDTGAG